MKTILILFLIKNIHALTHRCNDRTLSEWNELSSLKDLAEDWVVENYNCFNWTLVYQNTQFSVDFHRNHLRNFVKYNNIICRYQILPEYFIKEQAALVNWKLISQYQILTPKFVKEMKNWVDWYSIILYQDHIEHLLPDWIC